MPLITVPVGVAPLQVDDFPAEVVDGDKKRHFNRSCKGALHFRPSSSKVITQDELDHIVAHKDLKDFARRLIVVQIDVKKARSLKTAPPKASTPTPQPAPVVEKADAETKKKKK